MSTRHRLLHDWTRQVGALVPGVRVTRSRTLALLVVGMIWAGNVTLLKVAAALPMGAADVSTEQRLRRWLANPAVVVTDLWRAVLPSLLASRAGQEVLLVLDPTPHTDRATILAVGLVCRKRVLPVAWRVVSQQEGWPQRQIVYLRELFAEVAAALPMGCTVTLIGDRGLTGPAVLDACREVGWQPLFRLSAHERHGSLVRIGDDPEQPVWALVRGPGQRWTGRVALFKHAGWRTVELTMRWERGQDAPWLLVSDRPAGRRGCANTGAAPTPKRRMRIARSGAGTSRRARWPTWRASIGSCWRCTWRIGGAPNWGCARSGGATGAASTGPIGGMSAWRESDGRGWPTGSSGQPG
ncbi:MAG: hypothetical protein M3R06_08730, partial [Chloroflexota bacterium]|nr:hypothetical protein [Chloroflexota bacterium]